MNELWNAMYLDNVTVVSQLCGVCEDEVLWNLLRDSVNSSLCFDFLLSSLGIEKIQEFDEAEGVNLLHSIIRKTLDKNIAHQKVKKLLDLGVPSEIGTVVQLIANQNKTMPFLLCLCAQLLT